MRVCVSTACHRHTRLTDYHFCSIPSSAGAATVVAVNSRFTAQVFREAFARIAPKHPDPAVIYPAINLDSFVSPRFDEAGAGKGRRGKQQPAALGTFGFVLLPRPSTTRHHTTHATQHIYTSHQAPSSPSTASSARRTSDWRSRPSRPSARSSSPAAPPPRTRPPPRPCASSSLVRAWVRARTVSPSLMVYPPH